MNWYRKANVKGSFSLRVLDTKNLFTAEAVAAYEAVRLIKEENISFANLRIRMEEIFKNSYSYIVPNDLYYLRNIGIKKSSQRLGFMRYHIAKKLDTKPIIQGHLGSTKVFKTAKGFDATVQKLFAHARKQIEDGLQVPTVCMSYAGNLVKFTQRPDYQKFIQFCKKHKVNYTFSVTSITAGINFGPGTFTLAFVKDGLV